MKQEPVAYIYERQNGSAKLVWVREPHDKDIIKEVPLYTAPRELSDEEILKENRQLKQLIQLIISRQGKSFIKGLIPDGIILDEFTKESE